MARMQGTQTSILFELALRVSPVCTFGWVFNLWGLLGQGATCASGAGPVTETQWVFVEVLFDPLHQSGKQAIQTSQLPCFQMCKGIQKVEWLYGSEMAVHAENQEQLTPLGSFHHRSFFSGTASKKKISFWFFLEKFVKRLIFTSDQTEGICNARVHACMLSCFSRSRPFWDPMDCSPPGSSLHGILQARTLEWVAMPSTRRSSQPRNRNHVFYVSCIFRWILYH